MRPLDINKIKDIDDLNVKFNTWLECEYHRSPHRGLIDFITPIDAWISKSQYIKPISPSIDLDRIFMHFLTRKVYKDSTFTLDRTLFEAPSILAGKRVNIFFDPHPPITRILVTHAGKEYGYARIVDTYANSKIRRGYSKNGDLQTDDINSESHVNLTATDLGGM